MSERFRNTFAIVFMLMIVTGIAAQEKTSSLIKGTVIDSKTKEALTAASVYFAGTTIGTSVQSSGSYAITVTRPGNYELIVSMVGYETQKMKWFIEKEKEYIFNFRMEPKPLSLTTIEIEGAGQEEWQKNLKIFSVKFLGTIGNSDECTIVNKEYIDFKWKGDTLTAVAREPIFVVNNYLGYKVVCEIAKFIFHPSSSCYEYSMNTWFNEMKPKDENQKEEWMDNRECAFYGSPAHFLWALKYDILEPEGYKVAVFSIGGRNVRKIKSSKELMNTELSQDEPVYYFSGGMKVFYKGGQPSTLSMRLPYFSIDANGIADNHLPFTCSGYWGKLGIASMLPRDYLPESIKEKYDVAAK